MDCAHCGNAIDRERIDQVGRHRVKTCSGECAREHEKNIRRMNMRKLRRARREAGRVPLFGEVAQHCHATRGEPPEFRVVHTTYKDIRNCPDCPELQPDDS